MQQRSPPPMSSTPYRITTKRRLQSGRQPCRCQVRNELRGDRSGFPQTSCSRGRRGHRRKVDVSWSGRIPEEYRGGEERIQSAACNRQTSIATAPPGKCRRMHCLRRSSARAEKDPARSGRRRVLPRLEGHQTSLRGTTSSPSAVLCGPRTLIAFRADGLAPPVLTVV
jgi:hypothetical protein